MYDIMFFAETDMLPGGDETMDVPEGYTLLSLPRMPTLSAQRRGGAIALIIRDNIEFNERGNRLKHQDVSLVGFDYCAGVAIPLCGITLDICDALQPIGRPSCLDEMGLCRHVRE
ncbi:hypothetical protein B0H13DRAFT_1853359 [Mycena leptocephala]|nr:hypothetical protein B0H13DRAFT_1853359 [Mycena leptocephala]